MAAFLLGAGLPRQVALAGAYLGALVVHFTLNRQFVFSRQEGYALGLSAQGSRYLITAVAVYALTALGLALLPGILGIAPFVAWLCITATIGLLNFLLLGRLVFR